MKSSLCPEGQAGSDARNTEKQMTGTPDPHGGQEITMKLSDYWLLQPVWPEKWKSFLNADEEWFPLTIWTML